MRDGDDPLALLREAGGLLADLPAVDLDALAEVLEARRHAAGDILFRQDDRADGFHVVAEGTVRVFRLAPDGREQILHVFGPGELVGEVPVFQGGRFPACAAADGPAATVFVPADGFLALGRRNPQVLLDLLAVLSQRLRRFVHLIDDLSLKEVGARLARHLLDLRRDGGAAVELDSTKAVLANRLGTIAETLSRTLRKMQDRGLITVEGRRIALYDIDGLEELAEGLARL